MGLGVRARGRLRGRVGSNSNTKIALTGPDSSPNADPYPDPNAKPNANP